MGKKLRPANATTIEFRTHGIRVAKQTLQPIKTLDGNNNSFIDQDKFENVNDSEEYNSSDYDSGAGGDVDENEDKHSDDESTADNKQQSKGRKKRKKTILNITTINSDILTILSHLSNHKWKARRDILIYLKDVLNKILNHSRLIFIRVLHNNLVNIISIFELIYDPNSTVREQLRTFINWFVSQCKDQSHIQNKKQNKRKHKGSMTTQQIILGKMRYSSLHNSDSGINFGSGSDYYKNKSDETLNAEYQNRIIVGLFAPFWNVIMAHICAGLSHISNNIRFNTIKIFRTLFVMGNICEHFDFDLLINLLKHLSLLYDDMIKQGRIYSINDDEMDSIGTLKNNKNSKNSNKKRKHKTAKNNENIVIVNILAEIMANIVRAIDKVE